MNSRIKKISIIGLCAIITVVAASYFIYARAIKYEFGNSAEIILKSWKNENIFKPYPYKVDSTIFRVVNYSEANYSDSIKKVLNMVQMRFKIKIFGKPIISDVFYKATHDSTIRNLSDRLIFYAYGYRYLCDTIFYTGNSERIHFWKVKRGLIWEDEFIQNIWKTKIWKKIENGNKKTAG